MPDYLHIPLKKRLEAFRRTNKERLGGGWHEPEPHQRGISKWHWVPQGFRDQGGMRGGATFKVGSDDCCWCENLSGYFRNVKHADEIIHLNHRGWYVDMHQDEITRAIVLQLPSRNGQTQFMACCSDPNNKNCGILELHIYDDADTAARSADQLAETYADSCREDDLKQTADAEIEELRTEIKRIREHITKLVDGLRQSHLATVVCDEMRCTVKRLRQDMRNAKARIEKITDQPWILLPH